MSEAKPVKTGKTVKTENTKMPKKVDNQEMIAPSGKKEMAQKDNQEIKATTGKTNASKTDAPKADAIKTNETDAFKADTLKTDEGPVTSILEGKYKKEVFKKIQNYKVIEKAHAFLEDGLLKKLQYPEFPPYIEGNLVYSPKYQNWPVAKARVQLQFQMERENDVQSASVVTDANGYFCLSVPNEALTYDRMIVNVERNGVTQKFSFLRRETVIQEGNLGNLAVRDNFYVEGLFERVDSIVSSIGEVVSDFVPPSAQDAANPKVTLGEGDNLFTLTWANAPSYSFSYKILHRLVEPAVSPPAVISNNPLENKQRRDLGCPIDVVAFKKKLIESPHSHPRCSSLGMGYVLLMNQEWQPSHFSLGTLLYSVALAPGEEQRLVISERTEKLAVTDREASSYYQSDRYSSDQRDNITAIFESALEDTVEGISGMGGASIGGSFGSGSSAAGGGSWGLFSILGGAAALFGIGGSASASASGFSQEHTSDYSSNLTQSFQQNIRRAAETQSQANRIGVRLATAAESEMVTTKIIANNNHSHALTMQFWEVLHNYKVSSKITGVQLVLYIPLDLVQFLPTGVSHVLTPGQLYDMTQQSTGKENFMKRYDMLIKHHDQIAPYMPYEYREGLNILKKFASYPKWEFKSGEPEEGFTVYLKIRGSFMPYDSLQAVLRLKNGARIQAVNMHYDTHTIEAGFQKKEQLLEDIRRKRIEPSKTVTATFHIPPGVVDDDFASVELYYSSSTFNYTLTPVIPDYFKILFPEMNSEELVSLVYKKYFNEDLEVKLSPSQLRSLGALRLAEVELSRDAQTKYLSIRRDEELIYSTSYAIYDRIRTMTFDQLQKIERTFQHVVENTLHYSQAIWASLTSAERAIMLEQYTIGIPDQTGEIGEEVPLLNCVQNEVYGYYGNCMIMPFGYPPELADKLNTSTREVQDALYRYHTLTFRAPYTMVPLSTRGMVGEAVLGSSNASEKIDLTRFWNWQDSPITHADTIKPADFTQQHFITDNTAAPDGLAKTGNNVTINTPGATMLDLSGAVSKLPESPTLVGLEDLQKFASNLVNTSSAERLSVINNSSQMVQQAIAGYVNMKAGLGMNAEKSEAKKKEETQTQQKQEKPASTENQQKPAENNKQQKQEEPANQNTQQNIGGPSRPQPLGN